jgi:hypothetical protein
MKFNTTLNLSRHAWYVFVWAAISMVGCETTEEKPLSETRGFVPVYGPQADATIQLVDPLPVQDPGKIYQYNNYLLVNEINKGIHVFNNEDPANPTPVAFIKMVGNTDMAIKNDILYANHLGDIVAVDIEGFAKAETLSSIPFGKRYFGVLPPKGYYFECIDQTKGLVINWVEANINETTMDCYAIR